MPERILERAWFPFLTVLSVIITVDIGKDVVTFLARDVPLGPRAFLEQAIWWSAWLLLLPGVVWVTRRTEPERLGWAGSVAFHSVAGLVFVAVHIGLSAWGMVLARSSYAPTPWRAMFLGLMEGFFVSAYAIYAAAVVTYLAWSYHRRLRGAERDLDDVNEGEADARSGAPSVLPARRFLVKEADRSYFVRVDQVDWIEADGKTVVLHAGGEAHRVRKSLSSVLDRLDPSDFKRVHRSHAVNVDRISELHPWFGGDYLAVLRDGSELRVSRTYSRDLLELGA